MKNKLAISALLLMVSLRLLGQCKLDYSNYHLVYQDYFMTTGTNAYTGITTGTHPLSSNYSLTLPCYGGWGGDGGEYYDPSQLSFMPGGGLQFKAEKVPAVTCSTTGRTATYKSGMLRAVNTYQYGMFEIQAALYDNPKTKYSGWPTFWLATDPDLFEIDVFDGPNPSSATQMKTALGNNITNQSCMRFSQNVGAKLTDYNTYTCVWTPTRVTFFFNGREMYTIDNSRLTFQPVYNRVYLTLQMCNYFGVDVSYYWVKSLKIYQANNDPNRDSYQSPKEFMNHDVFGDPGSPGSTSTKVSPNYKSIATTADNNSVFYRGVDNRPYLALKSGSSWSIQSIFDATAPYPNSLIAGDIVYDKTSSKLFYRGQDGRLSYYIYGTWGTVTGWHQGYIDDNWSTTDNLVSSAPGSIAVANNGDVYYIGWDNVVHTWTASTNTFSRISVYPPSGANPVSDITVTYVGGFELRINYKGADNRLHVLGLNSGSTTAFWHAYITPATSLTAQIPGAYVCSDDTTTFFIGADKRIHRFYYTTSGFVEDPWFSSYTYSGTDVPMGNIAYDSYAPRLIYFGADGRLQYFQQAYSTATSSWYWYHAWIDDYWNTYEFMTNNTSSYGWAPGSTTAYWSPSLCVAPPGSSATYMYNGDCQFPFYATNTTIDETKNLRYFSYEPCEILDPPCETDWNTWQNNWANLARTYNNNDSLAQSVLAADDINVYPNPATDKITINYSSNTSGKFEINIQDVCGRSVYAESINCTAGQLIQHDVDINSYQKGIYLVNITLNNQHVVKKIVKI